ncbi:hypothetical protein SAMN05216169_10399 [Anoxybacillus pushchinoensis]|uniref:DUF4401 domain-containing protein n=1 Tax=Anoxybacillus pushchinoensis TaxID=150248 RepID=A0A1I0TQQ0_9BACL|nr:hypothetical protein [Anoxybacillus pushchinoensis]SFA54052.1 hypothetical protein SAMN05216169_10399 [Anoxybacillus pushchinoensis]
MEQKRKEIIINEIKYWKKTRLLPEQYCNFLLALYTEGNRDDVEQPARQVPTWAIRATAVMIGICLPFALLVIYFTELSFVLQTLILSLFVIICFIAVRFFAQNKMLTHIALIIGALSLLLFSIRLCDVYFSGSTSALAIAVMFNCFIWLLIGWRFSLTYFIISGIVGIILFISSFFI